ncbi:MAG: hypothetical protein ACI8SR_000450 [Oceanicoccus sp.]|jgi:hypothetical protein
MGLKITFLLFFIIFLIVFIFRVKNKLSTEKVIGRLIEVDEGFINIKQQYYNIKHFYPILSYEYNYQGRCYSGKTSKSDIRRYMIPEIDKWGMLNKDKVFFWRELKVGEDIPILVKVNNPNYSIINVSEEKRFKSENLVFLMLSLFFFALFCWV